MTDMKDVIEHEFGQAAMDYIISVYDKGVIDGLRLALLMVAAFPGTTTGTIKEGILRLIDNPPPREYP